MIEHGLARLRLVRAHERKLGHAPMSGHPLAVQSDALALGRRRKRAVARQQRMPAKELSAAAVGFLGAGRDERIGRTPPQKNEGNRQPLKSSTQPCLSIAGSDAGDDRRVFEVLDGKDHSLLNSTSAPETQVGLGE